MRRRIGIYGATDEALQLIPLLEANPDVEIPVVYDPDLEAARRRLRGLHPDLAQAISERLTDDPRRLEPPARLDAVIDAGLEPDFASRASDRSYEGIQIVAPLTARLLWGYSASSHDHKTELLQALHEVVESYNLTVDTDELFSRMLEIAMGGDIPGDRVTTP